MASSVVFHIGDPKTGVTALLRVLRDQSWSCNSVTVAAPGASGLTGSDAEGDEPDVTQVARGLWEGADPQTGAAGFAALAQWEATSEADVALLASDAFARVAPDVLNSLIGQYLPDHARSARIIAYLRPHPERFLQALVQRVRTGAYDGEDMATLLHRLRRQRALLAANRFRVWQSVFGQRFTLRPLVPDELAGGDALRDALSEITNGAQIRLEGSGRTFADDLPGLEVLSVLRDVQLVLHRADLPGPVRQAAGLALSRVLARSDARSDAPADMDRRGTPLRLGRAVCHTLREVCHDDAAALDMDFFQGGPMVAALDAALQDSADSDQGITGASLAAEQHFSAAALHQIRAAAQALAGVLANDPDAGANKEATVLYDQIAVCVTNSLNIAPAEASLKGTPR